MELAIKKWATTDNFFAASTGAIQFYYPKTDSTGKKILFYGVGATLLVFAVYQLSK